MEYTKAGVCTLEFRLHSSSFSEYLSRVKETPLKHFTDSWAGDHSREPGAGQKTEFFKAKNLGSFLG